ncbi:MAG: class I SAM-dependent methyltransferase [Acidobacteria bacterium]|nr:class I SAM-dependent methyltransferase [Acidobacteriota bacterium]MBV9477831.1 class I SAM-dependent methyltransferase [Acidobacteriota bacterium]
MTVIDKRRVLERPDALRDVVIELGCGPAKRHPNSIAVDLIDTDAADIVGDALEVLQRFPDASARLVTSSHFLEHVSDPAPLLDEMSRLLAPGGTIEIVVPHFSHPYFHSDPTHANRLGFGLYTMSYYARDPIFRRQVPGYVRRDRLTLRSVDLHFKSARPFYGRYAIKRVLGTLFNSCRYLQELWEENLCYIFPCYEIRYVLGRTDDVARRRAE